MLDESTRAAILRLAREGHGARTIAKALSISKGAVKKVLRQGHAAVPPLERAEKAEPYRAQILDLYASCRGNLVRVHEELARAGAALSYPALTAFCRRHGIGQAKKPPAGQYVFSPGQEMQHDTSPHRAQIGGRMWPVQSASLVLCHSRMTFVQMYPRFTRFECKVFLTDALLYLGGACATCMIDNTHVIVLSGTGRDMVAVPEMVAFGERFGFVFQAHALGDANRSARVERSMSFIENNFLAGRTFEDWKHLNQEARAWCDKINAAHRRHLHASPRELFAAERPRMKPLPVHVPDVYLLHGRIVDSEGYVNVHRNRYSAPWTLMGRQVEVRETKERIEIFDGPRMVGTHEKVVEPCDARIIDIRHRPARTEGVFARQKSEGEKRLGERVPEALALLSLMKRRGRATARELRWLLRLCDEYPREAFLRALEEATKYGMTDLARLERMTLRHIARDFFVLPRNAKVDPEEEDT